MGPHAGAADFDPAGIDYAALDTAVDGAVPALRASGLGSNAWVLSGEHTESGKPLLANDPHLRLEIPSVWYLAHISTPEFEVVGATLPGLPFPLLGRSRNLAWGFTNTGPDVQDLFIERIDPDDPARYLAPEGSLPFDVRTETIEVSGGDPIELEVRETRHGPVISDVLEDTEAYLEAGHVLAFSWTALADDDKSGEALVNATGAEDWEGFVAALRDLAVPQQTVVFADADGNIGYVAPGRVPIRASGQGHMPVPGWTGEHDWVDQVPFEALPGDNNPASGRIVTANNRMVALDYPYYLTDDWTAPYRAQRIEALLDARPKHDVASFSAIQQDLVSLAAARLTPVLLGLAEPSNDTMRTALAMLGEWDHGMQRDRTEPLIYMAWVRELMHVLFADELGDVFEDYWKIRTEPIHRALGERQAWCDDVSTEGAQETCAEAVSRALKVSLEYLAVTYGHDMERLALGRGPRGPHEEPHPGRGPGHRLLVRGQHADGRREGDGEGRRLRRGRPGAPVRPEPRRGLSRGLRPGRARELGLRHQHGAVRQPALVILRGLRRALARRGIPAHAHRPDAPWRRTRWGRWC